MPAPVRILLIEDDRGLADALRQVLAGQGFEATVASRGQAGLERAQAEAFAVVVSDLRLPDLNGLDLVRQLHAAQARLPIILMTAHGTTETAIEATKLGAFDYLLKPFEMPDFLELVQKAAAASRLMSEPVALGAPVGPHAALVGQGRAMQAVYKELGRVAAKPVTVLLRGETGTGKELVARALYQHSDRAAAPFVALNCTAIPETLFESELFGHERGAFTGADSRRIGRFEQAHRGTLFLDEIGDLPLNTQAKLLRVLQERCIQRLGGKELIPVDTRVIAATHRDLEAALRDKSFREDLYYRLSVVVIQLPPLRQRLEDIPALAQYFLRRHGPDLGVQSPAIQPGALAHLAQQAWPGNVRELENVLRQALLLAQGYPIALEHVRAVLRKAPVLTGAPGPGPASLAAIVAAMLAAANRGELVDVHDRLLADVERELFTQAIHLAQGNQAKAARWLGISRLTMREKLLYFGLHPAAERSTPEEAPG